jgi:hypothetical protein
MAREPKVYPPEVRRYVSGNLLCPSCGNTDQFQMSLRLRHSIQIKSEGLEISLNPVPTKKLLKALAENLYKVLDKGYYEDQPKIACANCGETDYIDLIERVTDACWSNGCMGCFWCGNWMAKEELLDACQACIIEHEGQITEEDCYSVCGYCDNGLSEVQAHYGLTLEEIKRTVGYQ